ncbi:MAG: 2,3-diketo-5-methylthio-1-phosphopentane phosphatase [Piptocephalis tieghemiana]|nr:MAG: 2,3-diketo-5-methylthio-1-phosphopentane phosphatase [Piptocephalis tieghemiana]
MTSTYDTVILDVEGTTTPITFVKDTLFPYFLQRLPSFLEDPQELQAMAPYIDALRAQADRDVQAGIPEARPIPNGGAEESKIILDQVTWQVKKDRKSGPLKALQSYIWKQGYLTGAFKGVVYQDVTRQLETWKAHHIPVYIYSSGSVQAQELLFSHSDQGDLLPFISGHFDTAIGSKIEPSSYQRIAQELHLSPERILFLSDRIQELHAAREAGMQARVVVRPGNAPITPEERDMYSAIESLDTL